MVQGLLSATYQPEPPPAPRTETVYLSDGNRSFPQSKMLGKTMKKIKRRGKTAAREGGQGKRRQGRVRENSGKGEKTFPILDFV
ncbi:hypothetical protein ACOSQ3_029450 [Xanthoceras sorbifolium]